MFFPEEVIFAPTNACNLSCAHCFVHEARPQKNELAADAACGFLASCLEAGREDILVGFSGGEPLMRESFISEVSSFAAAQGFLFSRVTTNGVFGASAEEREAALKAIFDAGFDGKVALSFDSFHGQGAKEAARFIRSCLDISGDNSAVEIMSAIPQCGDDAGFYSVFCEAAALLGCEAEVVAKDFARPCRFLLRGRDFAIPVYRFRQSLTASEMRWDAARWFEDDLCEGVGNCFFVHPDGSVAPCCGFANAHPALLIGKINDGYDALMQKALSHPAVRVCQGTGLLAFRKQLERSGVKFPGKTDDQCAFCGWALGREGLVSNTGIR